MRRATHATIGMILLVFGLLAISGTDVGAWFLILPAIPLALLSTAVDESARSGWLWDSAHSPPFLNPIGLAVVYFIPGIVLVVISILRRNPSSLSSAGLSDPAA
jgi:hypothetical protein